MSLAFTFKAPLVKWQGKGAWHFLALPKEAAAEIKFFNAAAKGFMPIPVVAIIGGTQWKTSIFPDSKSGSYMIAVKADVRKKENLADSQICAIQIEVRTEL